MLKKPRDERQAADDRRRRNRTIAIVVAVAGGAFLFLLVAGVVVAVGLYLRFGVGQDRGGGGAIEDPVSGSPPDAEEVFYSAVENALRTEYCHVEFRRMEVGSGTTFSADTLSADLDLREVRATKLEGRFEFDDLGAGSSMEAVVDGADGVYVKYGQLRLGDEEVDLADARDRWVRLGSHEEVASRAPGTEMPFADYALSFASASGLLPIGNFAEEDREGLLDLVRARGVYGDVGVAEERTENGETVYVYSSRPDVEAMIELMERLDEATGESYADTMRNESALYEGLTLTLKVDPNERRVVGVQATGDYFGEQAFAFSDFDRPVEIEPPEAEVTINRLYEVIYGDPSTI